MQGVNYNSVVSSNKLNNVTQMRNESNERALSLARDFSIGSAETGTIFLQISSAHLVMCPGGIPRDALLHAQSTWRCTSWGIPRDALLHAQSTWRCTSWGIPRDALLHAQSTWRCTLYEPPVKDGRHIIGTVPELTASGPDSTGSATNSTTPHFLR